MPGGVAIAHAAVDVVLGTIVKCRVNGDIGAAATMVVKERMIGRCHGGPVAFVVRRLQIYSHRFAAPTF